MSGSANIQPFRFQNLPVVSREEIYFLKALRKVLPMELIEQSVIADIVELLHRYIHTHLRWNPLGQERFLSFQQFRQLSLPPTLLLQIAILPGETRAFLELDPRISAMMVDRALGGTGEDILPGKPLSEVEKGVFSYLFLKALQHVHNHLEQQVKVEFRLETIIEDLDSLSSEEWEGTYFYRKEFHMALEKEHGFFRLYIPTRLVEEMSQSVPDRENTPQEYRFLQKRFHRVAEIPLTGSFRIGMFELEEEDLLSLQPDDVLPLSECMVELAEDTSLRGESVLQFGQRSEYGFRCSVGDDGNLQVLVQLQEILSLDRPQPSGTPDRSEFAPAMDDDPEAEYESDPYNENPPYLSSRVQVILELGRIQVTTRELLHYTLDKIIPLGRTPYDPFELYVQDKHVGQAVLEESNGELVARIVDFYW